MEELYTNEEKNEETLRRVEQNDDTLTTLRIGGSTGCVVDGVDFSRLGAGIANNNELRELILINPMSGLSITDEGFYDGIERNSSIQKLLINCCSILRRNIANEELHGILKTYQENNNLTSLDIWSAGLQNGGANIITTTLRRCTNLKNIVIFDCRLTTPQLLSMLETIRGRSSLEVLGLGLGFDISIETAGWEALSTLLEDPTCNIHTLDISRNELDKEGVTTLANSLVNNTKLKKLKLFNQNANPLDYIRIVDEDVFSTLLCNTRSINSIYLSNHTLQSVSYRFSPDLLLNLNRGTKKNHVAIKKILRFHPNIDMKPLFELASSEEGEQSLKALPYIIEWFERAMNAATEEGTGRHLDGNVNEWDDDVSDDPFSDSDSEFDEEETYDYKVQERKLSAIYEFALAMPLLFVPISHIKGEDKKRKR